MNFKTLAEKWVNGNSAFRTDPFYKEALKRLKNFKEGDRLVIVKPRYLHDSALENRTVERWLMKWEERNNGKLRKN